MILPSWSSLPRPEGTSRLMKMTARCLLMLTLCMAMIPASSPETTVSSTSSSSMQVEATGEATTPTNLAHHAPLECGVYMAPSTLGENVNLGIFTGQTLRAHQVVNFPELVIPLQFREWARHRRGFEDGAIWFRYIWDGYIMETETYNDTQRQASKAVFVPGVGCTVNGVADMHNIESTHGSVYDTTGLHRAKDPGAGAFTPYHGARTLATETIPPGAELVAAYGGEWIDNIEGAQITRHQELVQAEQFLKRQYYQGFILPQQELKEDPSSPVWAEVKEDLWEFTKNFPIYHQAFTNLPRAPWSAVEAVLAEQEQLEALPPEEEEPTAASEMPVVRHFIRKQAMRSIEWLNEHGYCQDHLKPGHSTLPQAGYGAFASRFLPKGTVVGYAPLIHAGELGHQLYTIDYDGGQRKQYDLVINYSFGHGNSTVLLTPYGGMVNYINHHGTAPNVAIRWPDHELIAHKPWWLNESTTFLHHTGKKIGLSFEYVALRDIGEGEEVFLDYGREWQEAWDEHVAHWQPLPGAERYVHSRDYVVQAGSPVDEEGSADQELARQEEGFFRTWRELESDPYPPNLVTMCLESFSWGRDGTYTWVPAAYRKKKHVRVYCDVMERYIKEGGEEDDEEEEEEVDEEEEEGIVKAKNKSKYEYTVRMKLKSGNQVLVHKVPPSGIFLYDRAFSYDWHMPNVFRHEIMIPDDMFPDAWRNGPAQRLPLPVLTARATSTWDDFGDPLAKKKLLSRKYNKKRLNPDTAGGAA